MTLELDPTSPASESVAQTEPAAEPTAPEHGTVEACEFEELLERAMEIVRARRAAAGAS